MILRNLAKECDRWRVSNRAGAAIANAALIDAGFITAENQTNVIDKSKLRRALQDYRKERQAEDINTLEENQGHAYYFDGKKNHVLMCGGRLTGEEVQHGQGIGVDQHEF